MCNCVWLRFVWVLSGKNSAPVSARRSLQYPCWARQPRDRIGFWTAHARKSTRIVRPSGSLYVTSRPPSCWSRAPLAVWSPGSGNGIFCPGYEIGQPWSCAPLSRSKYSAPACLLTDDTELIVIPMIHGSTLGMHESSPTTFGVCEGYDTVEAVSEGWGCSVWTTSTCLPFPLPVCLLLPLPVFVYVELSYAPPPGLQQSFAQCPVLPHFLHVLMSVELVLIVLVVRFLSGVGFKHLPLPFLLTFLERVNLHPVIICTRSISRWRGRME